MEKQGNSKAKSLVFVLFPFQGHINPMLELATILHSKGKTITIVHPEFNSPNPSKHPEFSYVPIRDNLSGSNIPPGDRVGFVSTLNRNCEAPLELCLKKLSEGDPNSQIACVVYDMLMYFAQNVADRLNLPGISVRTSAAATILAAAVFRKSDGQGLVSFPDYVSEDSASELEALEIKEILTSLSGNDTEAVLQVRETQASSLKKCKAIIANTMDFLEEAVLTKIEEYFPIKIFSIGPFHKLAPSASSSLLKEDASCISWLDKQAPKSVIYVSFGSMASVSEEELIEIAWGLANSGQPFLWVVRPGLVVGRSLDGLVELFPKKLEEKIKAKGYIVEWAPQKEVLAHRAVGGFWSHCGWNSTLESICEGVPFLCSPFFGDQLMNLRYICGLWKVGFEVGSELERGKIEKAVTKLMVDEEGKEVRLRAMEFKEKAEDSVREGGSTHQSLQQFVNHFI